MIDVAASLPFFVNISRLLAPKENEDTYSRLNRKFFALFAPLTWRPFVRLLVDMHIKAKMGELHIAYNQLALRLPEGKSSIHAGGVKVGGGIRIQTASVHSCPHMT